jgi:hypothetical protein
VTLRNQVYDGIATMLVQSQMKNKKGTNYEARTERCLYWVLALLRGNNPIPKNNDDNNVQNEKKSHDRNGGSLRVIGR